MNWLREHRMAFSVALARVREMPLSFSFNVMVIALALMLPLAGLTLLENLKPVSRELAVEPEISIFLANELPRERALALNAEIRDSARHAGINVRLDFIEREKALDILKQRAGLSDVATTLGGNPLPDAYVLKINSSEQTAGPAQIEKLAAALQHLQGVETVQLDAAWVKRLAALLELASSVLALLTLTLCSVVLAVVFNTIRLQVLTQHEEIGVSRLLGATNAFVARPFYYTGGLLGLCAGGLALLAVLGALALLNTSVTQLAQLYGSSFRLDPLNPATVLMLMLASGALGVVGAALSVRRALQSAV